MSPVPARSSAARAVQPLTGFTCARPLDHETYARRREGTVLRYLGEGLYSVSEVGQEEARTLEECLLHPRREDEEA